MFKISFFIIATLIALLANGASATELVELSDANLDLLNVDVGKALIAVQTALTSEFRFESFQQALDFVSKCKFLEAAMAPSKDDEFQGLAGKIKALLRDDQLQGRCRIDLGKFEDYEYLGEEEDDCYYLSRTRLHRLKNLGERLEKDPEMKQVLGHLFEKVAHDTGLELLEHAAEDTSIYFGERQTTHMFSFFTDIKYLSGCAISSVKPICQLVRSVSLDNVSAYGTDLAEFRQILLANDQDRIARRVEASGVTLKNLKDQCDEIKISMHPIDQVMNYLEAGYLSKEEIVEQKNNDPEFDFYCELKSLCQV